MMNPNKSSVADASVRREALDTSRSFIVQAPAGSGKTELLTQRYLALLAQVDEPEEILAITFTRKAAGEMRARVLKAMTRGADSKAPEQEHEQAVHQSVQAVRAHAMQRGWNLDRHPGRLRIQTIDSLNTALAGQMPLLSRLGAKPNPTEQAQPLYRRAARATLDLIEGDDDFAHAVEGLLRHLGNERGKAEKLLAQMLARRDQWLRHFTTFNRDQLEAALQDAARAGLALCLARMPQEHWSELLRLARFAAHNRVSAGARNDESLLACANIEHPPSDSADALTVWRGLVQLLLTKEGEWRKSPNASCGFPAPSEAGIGAQAKRERHARKQEFSELIAELKAVPELRAALAAISQLPPPHYTDAQWQALNALIENLRLSAAQLMLIFSEEGSEDFPEAARRALDALGAEETPSDLALALDYRIRHILIDEFQDTSRTQFELLKRLTAGWEPDDGRTLFVVGDPMQSIYRFREADVGLFLQARTEGIGALTLTPLKLTVNFRSQQGIVDWVNDCFSTVFTPHEHALSGAVNYAASQAFHALLDGDAVHLHAFPPGDAAAEAQVVVRVIKETRAENEQARIAVLVRARTALRDIVAALQQAGLKFRAVEIDNLSARPVVRDLLSITRALAQLEDRIAWLSILRAPWCGLTLTDLSVIAEDDSRCLFACMGDCEVQSRLSADGQRRLARVTPIFAERLAQRGRQSLRRSVEGIWLQLGGPGAVPDRRSLADAESFLRLLEKHEQGGQLVDFVALDEALVQLYAEPDVEADDRLQIMTIHKAKGLEFDTVILPGLNRKPRGESRRLVDWLERSAEAEGLLLAPIAASGAEEESIGSYIRGQEKLREQHEIVRVAYVAATRAKNRLHLLAQLGVDPQSGEIKQPPSGSLLYHLWPALGGKFSPPAPAVAPPVVVTARLPLKLERLDPGWAALPPISALTSLPSVSEAAPAQEKIEFDWAGETARHVGVVIHLWLQMIGRTGLAQWTESRVTAQKGAMRAAFTALGTEPKALDLAVQKVVSAVIQTLVDPRGRWIFSQEHTDARCEYALTAMMNGKRVRIVVDRTFVDEAGQRWIVDYKTGIHTGADADVFLSREMQRYQQQLKIYADIMRLRDDRPIRTGLYFPLMQGWGEGPKLNVSL